MLTVAGIVPFTTIDFPEHLAAVFFLRGCPLRCPFCHNPELQEPQGEAIPAAEIAAFLKKHRKKLDGIVLSGGEPLMAPDVLALMREIKESGYKLGIHTAGVYPELLAEALPLTDWVGLDVKAPWGKYDVLSGRRGMAPKVRKSLALLKKAAVPFEARTTCDPRFLTPADIAVLGEELARLGVGCYALQKYRTFSGDKNPPSAAQTEAFFKDAALMEKLRGLFPQFVVR